MRPIQVTSETAQARDSRSERLWNVAATQPMLSCSSELQLVNAFSNGDPSGGFQSLSKASKPPSMGINAFAG
jgi:hypothetical protein